MKQKRLALLMLDGYGLSLSWQGNAIASAKPVEFERLWNSYRHVPLLPCLKPEDKIERNFFPELSHSFIGLSKNVCSNKEFVDSEMYGDFLGNQRLSSVFAYAKQHSSSLHVMGNLSNHGEIGAGNQIEGVLKLAKLSKIDRIYIHLIVDESYFSADEVKSSLLKFEEIVESHKLGEIASLCGERYFRDQSLWQKAVRGIFGNSADRALSLGQAVARQTELLVENYSPILIGSDPRRIFSDFDVLVLTNHTNDRIAEFVRHNLVGRSVVLPKFSIVIALTSVLNVRNDQLPVALRRSQDDFLVQELKLKNKRISLLTLKPDEHSFICRFAGTDDYDSYQTVDCNYGSLTPSSTSSVIEKFFGNLRTQIENSENDAIFAHFGALPAACRVGDFGLVKSVVAAIDEKLPALEKAALESNTTLVIVSPFGMAERMLARSKEKLDNYHCLPSDSHLPMVVISSASKIDNSKSKGFVLTEIMKAKRDIRSVNAYVYNFFAK
ncbi:MAG TPA: hypothetical protein PK263_05975, partial [bacterium]|nr:hypothetical protein [bacterium]